MFNFFRRNERDAEIMQAVRETVCVVVDGVIHFRDGCEIASRPVTPDGSGVITRQNVALFIGASPRNLAIAQALAIAEGMATPDDFASPSHPFLGLSIN